MVLLNTVVFVGSPRTMCLFFINRDRTVRGRCGSVIRVEFNLRYVTQEVTDEEREEGRWASCSTSEKGFRILWCFGDEKHNKSSGSS